MTTPPAGTMTVDRQSAGAGRPGRDRAGIELAGGVGAGQHPHRAACRSAIVQVQADRDHPRQQVGRGVGVGDAALARPGAEAGHVATFTDRDGQVLVPGEVPVHGRRSCRRRARAPRTLPVPRTDSAIVVSSGERASRPTSGDPPEQVPPAVDLAPTIEPAVVVARRVRPRRLDQLGHPRGGRDAFEDRVAVAGETLRPARGRRRFSGHLGVLQRLAIRPPIRERARVATDRRILRQDADRGPGQLPPDSAGSGDALEPRRPARIGAEEVSFRPALW